MNVNFFKKLEAKYKYQMLSIHNQNTSTVILTNKSSYKTLH